MSKRTLDRWLIARTAAVGRHALLLLSEIEGARRKVLNDVRRIMRGHYVTPAVMAKRLEDLGALQTARLIREHLPTLKTARSGDLGEILATEITEHRLGYTVPVRRLRWKDGREMSLRGDDIVGIVYDEEGKLQFLKGESKSRAVLANSVLEEAAQALDRDRGRPSRYSVLFVADRLREQGNDVLAKALEEAVLQSFRGSNVEHLLFVLTGTNPERLLSQHLKACEKKRRRRHAVGVQIQGHGEFIVKVFRGM